MYRMSRHHASHAEHALDMICKIGCDALLSFTHASESTFVRLHIFPSRKSNGSKPVMKDMPETRTKPSKVHASELELDDRFAQDLTTDASINDIACVGKCHFHCHLMARDVKLQWVFGIDADCGNTAIRRVHSQSSAAQHLVTKLPGATDTSPSVLHTKISVRLGH